ncbi:MAG TPA: retropepsin-like aspartic protease [Steroidobacteraceae bacterium]
MNNGSLWLWLLAASSLFGSAADAKDDVCEVVKLTKIELQMRPEVSSEILVPVKMGDSDAWMVLNAGSAFSVLMEKAASSLRLPVREVRSSGAWIEFGGKTLDRLATVDSFQLGTVHYGKGTEFLVWSRPGPLNSYKGLPIIGLLGMDVFSHVDVELDLARRTLNLFAQESCGGGVYWSRTFASVPILRSPFGNLYFPMELEGKWIKTTFSTVSPESSLRTDVSKRVFGFDERSSGNEVDGSSGKQATYYRAMKLTTPGLTVTNAKIRLREPPRGCSVDVPGRASNGVGYEGCGGVYPMALGLSVLQKLHLYFATKENVLYFTAADAPQTEVSATPISAVPATAPAPTPGDAPAAGK